MVVEEHESKNGEPGAYIYAWMRSISSIALFIDKLEDGYLSISWVRFRVGVGLELGFTTFPIPFAVFFLSITNSQWSYINKRV